jgi:hypothetical protein
MFCNLTVCTFLLLRSVSSGVSELDSPAFLWTGLLGLLSMVEVRNLANLSSYRKFKQNEVLCSQVQAWPRHVKILDAFGSEN